MDMDFCRSTVLVRCSSDNTSSDQSRHINKGPLSPFRPEIRRVLKIVTRHGCAILVVALVATIAYPLCGLVVGYVSAVTAIQVLGERGGEIMVEPGPYVLLRFMFMSLLLAAGGVGYPVYRATLNSYVRSLH